MHKHTIAVLLGTAVLVAAAPFAAAGEKQTDTGPAGAGPKPVPVAHIRLGGAVLDRPPDFSLFGAHSGYMTLSDWLKRLAKARTDPEIRAVAIELDNPRMSWAQAQELADAVRRLDAVKPVHAHITSAGASQYVVASAARDLAIEPGGGIEIIGLAAELLFFRGTLDKLGIQPQFVQIGRFKGASEPFSRTRPSRELALELDKILDGIYEQLCGQIARQRKLSGARVRAVIDNGPFDADDAKKFGLVDRLAGRHEWLDTVARRAAPGKDETVAWKTAYGKKPSVGLDLSNPFSLLATLFKGRGGPEVREPTVAVIHAEGMIVSGSSGSGLFGLHVVGARTLVRTFDRVRKDGRIKGVIFRVDSPGGSALASELIYQAVRCCAAAKPVIVSVADQAASGGYYIAAGGTRIIADPGAIVGSIGVVSGKLSLQDFLADKLGITTYAMTRGKNAGLVLSRPWTKEELAIVRKQARKTYDLFVARVRQGRGKVFAKEADLQAVTQGRIFTAAQAKANGLIDEIGGMNEALIAVRRAAGVQKCHLISLPRLKTLMDLLSGEDEDAAAVRLEPDASQRLRLAVLERLAERTQGFVYLLNLAEQMKTERVLAAAPWHLSIRR